MSLEALDLAERLESLFAGCLFVLVLAYPFTNGVVRDAVTPARRGVAHRAHLT
jgi:hypothetical protein